MDRWGLKHVELIYVMNKTQSLKNFVYLVGLHIYYKMIHGPYNIESYLCIEVSSLVLHIQMVVRMGHDCWNSGGKW